MCVYVCVCVCMYLSHINHNFFIHTPIDRHLGCFHILAIINNSVLNIALHVSFCISVFIFFRYIPRSGIAGSYCSFIFNFLRKLYTVLHSGCTNLHSHNSELSFPFLYFLTNIYYIYFLFDNSHSERCEVIFH